MLQEDFAAIVPGNKVPLNGEALLRLFLYLCLLLFVFRLFFGSAAGADPDFFQWENPPAPGVEVENPRSI